MNNAYNQIHSAFNGYESISEAEITADFNSQSSEGSDDDFDTCFVPNRVDDVPPVAMQDGLDDDDWTDDDWTDDRQPAQTLLEDDPLDASAQRHQHSQLVKGLLLTLIDEHQSVTAADICGREQWDCFSDDEKYRAEYLIAELISELRLPLMADSDQSYPAPRRYFFI